MRRRTKAGPDQAKRSRRFILEAGLLWYRWPVNADDGTAARVAVVLIVAAAHALYFLLVVGPNSVKTAARTYARQLILSCETFLAGAKVKPAPKAQPKRRGAGAGDRSGKN
jgi:hypothetical protein